MPAPHDKTTHTQLYSIATQEDDTNLIPIGGSSLSGTAVLGVNGMGGAALWNQVAYTHKVGAVSAGSFHVTLWGRVNGMSYIIAEHRNGPAIAGQFPFDVTTHTPYTPRPTHVMFDETAAGGLTSTINAVAKQYRGWYPGATSRYADKIIEGAFLGSTTTTTDTTYTLSNNPAASAGGASGSRIAGTDKIYLWDALCTYANITACSATHQLHLVGTVAGSTVIIASTPQYSGVTKLAFQNQFYGPVPKPTAILHTNITGGGPTTTFQVDFIGKANKGRRFRI